MTIERIGSGSAAPRGPEEADETKRPERAANVVPPRTARDAADTVQISREGRALASAGPTPERIESLRMRIADGTYDKPETALEVARGLLASGDLD